MWIAESAVPLDGDGEFRRQTVIGGAWVMCTNLYFMVAEWSVGWSGGRLRQADLPAATAVVQV